MQEMESTITHNGVVVSTEPGRVSVSVTQQAACQGCAAASYCRSSEGRQRLIDVGTSEPYGVGDEVVVVASVRQSRLAVVVAYVCPLILLLAVLTGVISLGFGEAQAALAGLLAVAVYYAVLYAFRSKLSKRFGFEIKKTNIKD